MMLTKEEVLDVVLAHQYLYYVRCAPIISDHEYDQLCRAYGIHGGGGSDREQDYPPHIKELAGNLTFLLTYH